MSSRGVAPKPPGRGQNLRAAVLNATLAELAEHGYASMTVDNVARRAGVHKTSLYRHWPDRQSLVLDALTSNVAESMPIPDTSNVANDLTEYARSLVSWLTSPIGQAVVATTISDAIRFARYLHPVLSTTKVAAANVGRVTRDIFRLSSAAAQVALR